jgi:hypothetical protein
MIPFLAKNCRLGYFFYANNPHRQQVGLSDSPEKRESDYSECVLSNFVKCIDEFKTKIIAYNLNLARIIKNHTNQIA